VPSAPQPAWQADTLGSATGAEPRLRLWPALVFALVQWIAIRVTQYFAPVTPVHMFGTMLGPLVGALGVMGWWLLASRAGWRDRWIGLLVFIGAGALAYPFMDVSLNLLGVIITMLPTVTTAWVVWLMVTPFLGWRVRRAGMLTVIVLAWAFFLLVRFDGVYGVFDPQLPWRWTPAPGQLH